VGGVRGVINTKAENLPSVRLELSEKNISLMKSGASHSILAQ